MIRTIKKNFRHFFIPSETNNFKAKLLHLDFLTFYLLLAVFFGLLYNKTTLSVFYQGAVLGATTDITAEKLFELTNKERIKYGLSPLKYNQTLANAAYEKAQNMLKLNYWAHYAPDGTTPWDFFMSSGYKYKYAGENLAKDFSLADAVVAAWMDSKTHKENILRKEYDEIGFAVVDGYLTGHQTTLVVQMFGSPITKTIQPVSINLENKTSPVLGNAKNYQPLINLKKISQDYTIIFLIILLAILFLDLFFACKYRVVRITGKHLAHFIFIMAILLSIFIIGKGAIL